MSSGFVLSCLSRVIESAPSGFDHISKLRQLGEDILSKSLTEKQDTFQEFSHVIVSYMREQITTACGRCKSTSSKRSKLWSSFHKLRTDTQGYLVSKWNELLSSLRVNDESDKILMQAVFRQILEDCVCEYFTTTGPTVSSLPEVESSLMTDEVNALRYACGYVAHSMLKRFEKRKGDKFYQFVACLGEMSVPGKGDDVLAYTEKWLSLVNRGGLFPPNDHAFTFLLR